MAKAKPGRVTLDPPVEEVKVEDVIGPPTIRSYDLVASRGGYDLSGRRFEVGDVLGKLQINLDLPTEFVQASMFQTISVREGK